jgi:ANTAR domain/GAF domain
VPRHALARSMNNDFPHFGTITNFDGEEATIALSGAVTSGAAFQLGAVLDAAIELEPASVVLDAAELEFIGPAGLLAVSSAEMRLVASGSKLSLRSPSALVNRLLGIVEMAESARLDGATHGRNHLGPEQRGEMPAVFRHARGDTSTEDFRQVTALPVDPEVIDGALRLVVDLARVSVRGADGVSVSLLCGGVLSTVAASDRTIMSMDADQYATGEGPCVDASLQGRWFHAESLDSETRWPSFTPKARELGIKAILSSPLKALEEPIGALNIYSRTAATFDVKGQETAAVFAHRASVILSDARAGVGETQMAVRFQEALRTREIITLAKGIIMEREGIDEDAAFTALLRLALYAGAPLRRRAEEMVLSTKQPELGLRWGLDD